MNFSWTTPIIIGPLSDDDRCRMETFIIKTAEEAIKENMIRTALLLSVFGMDCDSEFPEGLPESINLTIPTIQDDIGHYPIRFERNESGAKRIMPFLNRQTLSGVTAEVNLDYEKPGLVQFSQMYAGSERCQFSTKRREFDCGKNKFQIELDINLVKFDAKWFDSEFVETNESKIVVDSSISSQ